VLDDLQWADDVSLAAWQRLLRATIQISTRPVIGFPASAIPGGSRPAAGGH
jgi:hypothetical protein